MGDGVYWGIGEQEYIDTHLKKEGGTSQISYTRKLIYLPNEDGMATDRVVYKYTVHIGMSVQQYDSLWTWSRYISGYVAKIRSGLE